MSNRSMHTPMRTVLGLGSAHSGTEHFWRQRLTGAANAVLVTAFIVILAMIVGRPYAEIVSVLSSPVVAVILLLLVASVATHMRIGMQVVIEDYVHAEALRVIALVANTFFAVAVAVVAGVAILKLAFGG
jgi:succinate dehydrogenase / fumarate reductase membrane anchor subunit